LILPPQGGADLALPLPYHSALSLQDTGR